VANTILTLLSGERLRESYAAGHWLDETLYAVVARHASRTPEAVAVLSSAARLSYSGLAARADAFSRTLAASGLLRGDRVAVWLPSRIDVAVALVACSRNGYVCCPSLHRDHTVADTVELCGRMRAAAFVGQEGYGADADRKDVFSRLAATGVLKHVERLAPAAPGRIDLGEVLGTEADRRDPVPRHAGEQEATLQSTQEQAPEHTTPPKTDPDSVLYLAFTSGTTGQPKGVMHSDNTLLANARSLIADWGFTERSVVYTLSPLSHNLGLGSLVLALAAGGTLVVHDLARGRSLVDRVEEVGATFMVGVPTHAVDLLAELKARRLRAPASLKGFRISGAAAPRAVVAELLRFGVVPQSGYGMTEAGSTHYTLPDDGPDRIIGSSGKCCRSYEVRLWSREDPDREAPAGEIGQIGGRGASLMLGYFDYQAANDGAFNRHGWFMTGDLGRISADGYIEITGRKKDLIIRGGHNIYPARIEALAMQHPGIVRAAAIPIPDARLGERVCLAVMPKLGTALDSGDILAHLNGAGLSRYDMPEYFLAIDEIPLTASGKILKRSLVEQVADRTLVPQPVRWTASVPTKGPAA
jgi:acyl-CoA synthetase